MKLPLIRFRVEDRGYRTPCWIYVGRVGASHGYPQIRDRDRGQPTTLHRWLYNVLVRRLSPAEHVDHLCAVKLCVRPSHLEAVAPAENTRRGRAAKLTWTDVAAIRARRASGELLRVIAADFGITNQAVSDIARGKRWAA